MNRARSANPQLEVVRGPSVARGRRRNYQNMQYLPLTLDGPAANLALDEALLESAEQGAGPGEVFRIWEPTNHFVVLGRSSRAPDEVYLEACQRDQVEVWRRPSGGGVVVAGPGCLMYAVVLPFDGRAQFGVVDQAHETVLERVAQALRELVPDAAREGISDLTFADPAGERRKFSGNSVRLRRRHLLYHGTLLYDFDLSLIDRWLRSPPRQPEYRQSRSHGEFIANLPIKRDALIAALTAAWQVGPTLDAWPRLKTAELLRTKYAEPVAST